MAELEENGTGFRMAIKDFAKRENLMVNTYEIRMIKSLLNSSMFKLFQDRPKIASKWCHDQHGIECC